MMSSIMLAHRPRPILIMNREYTFCRFVQEDRTRITVQVLCEMHVKLQLMAMHVCPSISMLAAVPSVMLHIHLRSRIRSYSIKRIMTTHIFRNHLALLHHELVIICEIAVVLVLVRVEKHLYRGVPQRRVPFKSAWRLS